MRMLESIRYCNECPFLRSIKNEYGNSKLSCSLPKFLDANANALELSNINYLRPPQECLLKTESIGIELESNKEVVITMPPSAGSKKDDKKLDGVD